MARSAAVALVFASVPACLDAAEDDDLVFSTAATEACLSESPAESAVACVGRAAEACQAQGFGQTNAGMAMCFAAERDFWDGRLNAAYGDLMALERDTDAALREVGSSAPSSADALRDMQRAWIVWRDAACAYERSQWGGGSGAGPAGAACQMQLTGTQALALEARLAERRNQ